MADAKALAGSLAGMRPEQAQRTAQHSVDALQRDQQQQQEMLQMALGAAMEKRRTELREREVSVQETYMQNQSEKLRYELDKMRFEQQMMDQLGNMTVETTQGPMKGDLAMGLHSLGMPLFQEGAKLQWQTVNMDGGMHVVSFDPVTGQAQKQFIGEVGEDSELTERLDKAAKQLLELYGTDAFSGLDQGDQAKYHAETSLAYQAAREYPGFEGRELANWAFEQTRAYNDEYNNLLGLGSKPRYGDRVNQHKVNVVNQIARLLPYIDDFYMERGVRVDYFSPIRLHRQVQSLGYDSEEAYQMINQAAALTETEGE